MNAKAGDITTSATSAIDALTGDVDLSAGKGIAINGTVTAQKNVVMNAKDGNIANSAAIKATTGNVDMKASQDVIVNNTVTAEAGDVSMLASNGNINLNQTVTAANEVALEATKGAIVGNSAKPPIYHVVAKVFKAIAAKGISLRTNIQELVGKVTGKGNVIIDQTGDLLADVITADGAITVTADSTIDAKNIISTTDTDDNDITLTSKNANILIGKVEAGQGKNADVILSALNGSVTAKRPSGGPVVADNLTVTAKSDIDLDTTVNSANLIVNKDGKIAINETDDLVLKANTKGKGSISIVAGGELAATDVVAGNGSINLVAKNDVIATRVESTTNATGNDINITSKESDIVADSIVAGSGTGGNVSLTAENGAIRRSNTRNSGINVVGNTVYFRAKNNIGGLDIKVGKLNAYSSQGNILLAAVANLIVQELHAKNGNIKLTASGAISDDNNNDTKIIARDLTLEATNGIGLQGDAATRALDTEVGSLAASVSGLGGINIDQKGDLAIKNVTTADGDITLNVQGNVGLDLIDANGTDNTVTLKAIGGAITDINDTDTEKKVNIDSDYVVIEGSKGVGTRDNAIEISTSNITGNGGSGGLYIDYSRDKVFVNDYITNGGDIVMTSPGEFVINSPILNLGGGSIYITVTDTGRGDDNLVINADISTVGNGSVYLSADDFIYQNANITVENRGNIEVTAGQSIYMATGSEILQGGRVFATSTADLGNIVYKAKGEIVLGRLITSLTNRGGTVTVDANSVRNGNASGEAALQSAYISVNIRQDATKNHVNSLISGLDRSYGIWLNNRLVGGLVSRDSGFIGQPHMSNSRGDLGYKLYQEGDRNDNPLIDSSSYEEKGFVYDKEAGSWLLKL